MNKDKRRRVIHWVAFLAALLSFVTLIVLIGGEVYVRWYVNQNFTFLGGFALEALMLMFTALTLGLLYHERT